MESLRCVFSYEYIPDAAPFRGKLMFDTYGVVATWGGETLCAVFYDDIRSLETTGSVLGWFKLTARRVTLYIQPESAVRFAQYWRERGVKITTVAKLE